MGESNGIGRKWSLSPSGACADVLRASFTAKKIKKIGKNNYFFKILFHTLYTSNPSMEFLVQVSLQTVSITKICIYR